MADSMSETARVLIVDDEPSIRAAFREMLHAHGVAALEAGDGIEALEVLKANPAIAVMLSDIRMPRMNGYDLMLEAVELRPDLQVVMMSGYSEDPVAAAMLRNRRIRTLFKPVSLDTMTEVVLNMLAKA